MSDNPSTDSTTDLEPPFVELTPPNVSDLKITWLVIAKNRRVNREWEALIEQIALRLKSGATQTKPASAG